MSSIPGIPHPFASTRSPSPCPFGPADLAQHLPRLHRLARRILGCAHLADDAVQDALIALWLAPAAGDGSPQHQRRRLTRAVVLRALHKRRALLRRLRHERAAEPAAAGECDNPLHRAWLNELRERVVDALAALPPPQREVLCLRAEHGLDYHDLAGRTGAPLGSVRSRLNRARRRMLELLPEVGSTHGG
jgi:RNA polymerase sigma-70 factor (ECF subfamily)